jgi:drug/metabolite transporter (DMT)-like permease
MGFARGGEVDTAMILGLSISVPLYLMFVPLEGGLHLDRVTGTALTGYILGGLLGTGIGRRWLYLAVQKIGAAPATAIKNSAPLITTALAMAFLGERVTLFQWMAIVTIIVGVSLVSWKAGAGIGQLMNVGILAAFGAMLSYGVRPLFVKWGLEAADLPLTSALIGATAALLYAILVARPGSIKIWSGPREALIFFVGAGLLQSFGFLALNYGLSAADVSVVYPVTTTTPLFTLAFTVLLLRGVEKLTWRIAVGTVAVVAGVIVL